MARAGPLHLDAALIAVGRVGVDDVRRRLAMLDEEARAAVLVDVRRRLESLPPEAFLDTSDVVVATATAP